MRSDSTGRHAAVAFRLRRRRFVVDDLLDELARGFLGLGGREVDVDGDAGAQRQRRRDRHAHETTEPCAAHDA
jgi:hypothetical protein